MTGEPTSEQDTRKKLNTCQQVACECNKENQVSATVCNMNTGNGMNITTYKWQDV